VIQDYNVHFFQVWKNQVMILSLDFTLECVNDDSVNE
jgi:hypothetical protein